MKFLYKKIAKNIVRPVIPVELISNEDSILYDALVDSGADNCIFDAQIADALGINLEKGILDYVGGINGKPEPYYIHKINIKVGGSEHQIYAGFKKNFPKFGYGVLGQKGFFEHFVVKFDYHKGDLELFPRSNHRA